MIISEQERIISDSKSVAEIMKAILSSEHETDQGREHFWTIGANMKNIIQYIELVSLGSLSESIVTPRETFRLAVMKGVASIILCHNHPSGDSHPSQKDIALTRRLRDAGQILGIEVLDHVIIGKTAHGFSFRDHGLFFSPQPAVPETTPVSPRRKKAAKKTAGDEWIFPPVFDMRSDGAAIVKRSENIQTGVQEVSVD